MLTLGYSPENNMKVVAFIMLYLIPLSLSDRSKECRGCKKDKERISIAFSVNSVGGKESPSQLNRERRNILLLMKVSSHSRDLTDKSAL